MKTSRMKFAICALFIGASSVAIAQDDDGIYGDIYETPEVQTDVVPADSVSPLDGYSTVDDYYPEGGYTPQNNNSGRQNSEQYVDQNGNTVVNNYYGDYYEDDNDFEYAARINRFHSGNLGWGYYDPWYTNMYWYTYDPFFWGTSIYAGAWPRWNVGFGWNNWGWGGGWNNWGWGGGWNNWGWNSGFGWNNCWGGGWNNWGWGGGLGWNAYNQGYWNGFNDGLAIGGYYNTYDLNSGIYNGPRGSSGNSGGIGTGYRTTSFASVYNKAAQEGKVNHANLNNVLQTADAKAVKGRVVSNEPRSSVSNIRAIESKQTAATERSANQGSNVRSTTSSSTRVNPYQRPTTERSAVSRPQSSTVDRSRQRSYTDQNRSSVNPSIRSNTYQRGSSTTQYPNRQYVQPSRSNSTNQYQRPNSSTPNRYVQPSRSGTDTRTNQFNRPSNQPQVPSRNYTAPRPTRTQPATPNRSTTPNRSVTPNRSTQPTRSVSPPSRGSSNGGSFSTPSRSFSSPSSGSRGGGSSPSRSSGGSRGGRP